MNAIFYKEIKSFFGSLSGYLVIVFFLTINGLMLFVIENPFNIQKNSYADLTSFFTLAPWIFLFLIPAITMKMLSEERKLGTLEILFTKPLSAMDVIVGKWMAAMVLIFFSLLPTLVYLWIVYDHTLQSSRFDFGSTLGSYFGLLFIGSAYTAIGLFTSSLSSNQLLSFVYAFLLCFVLYYGIENISEWLNQNYWISYLGMESHYKSIGRGVIDTRDLIYFVSVTILFWLLTDWKVALLKNK